MGDDSVLKSWLPGPIHHKLESERRRERDVPYFLNPYAPETVALPLSYFDVGMAMNLLTTPLSYYLITTLDVSSTAYSAYTTLISLPWCLKFLFGMLSDGNPILQYRRKSWLLIGWLLYIGTSFFMSFFSSPNFTGVTVSMFFMTCSYLLADVCAVRMLLVSCCSLISCRIFRMHRVLNARVLKQRNGRERFKHLRTQFDHLAE